MNRLSQRILGVGSATFLGFCVLVLSACSTQTSYKYLDWIIPWYVEGMVTLDEDQQELLNRYLKTNLSWHKQTQIPAYIDSLEEIKTDLDGLNVGKLRKYYRMYEAYWSRILVKTSPHVINLLQTASEQQIEELFDNLVSQNKELREKYITPSHTAIAKARSDHFSQQISYWIGDLSSRQLKAIKAWSKRLLPTNDLWIQHRLQWQENFRMALRVRFDSELFEPVMQDLLVAPDQYWSRQYRRTQQTNEHKTIELLLYLSRDMSKEQISFLNRRIDELIEQLSAIHYQSS